MQTGRGGFALVDALVALTLFASTLSLAIGAANVGRKLATSARETHAAAVVLDYLLAQPLDAIGAKSGSDDQFEWIVSLANDGPAGPTLNFDLCRQAVTAKSRGTGRMFSAAALAPCPVERT